jgi:hypothetical protein
VSRHENCHNRDGQKRFRRITEMKNNYIELLRQIEKLESARVISYVLGDRLQGPQASIAMDALGLFYRHLEAIKRVKKIAMFLYSVGGDTMVPWRLVNLIREYCDEFVVLVPYKAHSAATLICLGADEIVMCKMGELSPIDPSVANAFNPTPSTPPTAPPQVQPAKIPISVEDVAAYFRLATDRAKLDTAETRLGALQQLTNVVHPLALGNVERSHTQIRALAKKLLGLHMDTTSKDQLQKVESIIDTLTEKLYSHQHLIPRNEAKNIIGLKVRYAADDLERPMMDLFEEYKRDLGIGSIVNPVIMLQDRTELPVEFTVAKVETTETEDKFNIKGKIVRSSQAGQPPSVNIYEQGWQKVK